MMCERCGKPVEEGEHGRWRCPLEPRPSSLGVIDDQLEGGPRRFETMGHDAPYIESKSQWRREVEARNLEPIDKHDRAYYNRSRKQHMERLADTGRAD